MKPKSLWLRTARVSYLWVNTRIQQVTKLSQVVSGWNLSKTKKERLFLKVEPKRKRLHLGLGTLTMQRLECKVTTHWQLNDALNFSNLGSYTDRPASANLLRLCNQNVDTMESGEPWMRLSRAKLLLTDTSRLRFLMFTKYHQDDKSPSSSPYVIWIVSHIFVTQIGGLGWKKW